jgi:hypothetical protein
MTSTNPNTGSWIIASRRPIVRYEVDPIMAPLLRIDRRIGVTAKCPAGHTMPFEVTADEAVVRGVEGSGVTICCEKCEMNYDLDLGTWPDSFTGDRATT